MICVGTAVKRLALAALTGIAALFSQAADAQSGVTSECPVHMRVYHVTLYHGIGYQGPAAAAFPVCLGGINLKFDYGGPRNMSGRLQPGQFATADGLVAQQSDARSDYGEELDRMLAQGTGEPGKGDTFSTGGAFDLDTFTMVFSGTFRFNGGNYTLTYGSDDGIRVWIDGRMVIDDWKDGAFEFRRKEVFLPAGYHSVLVAFYENRWNAGVYFDWSPYH